MISSKTKRRIKTYFKVGELLHLIAFISFIFFIAFYKVASFQYDKHHIILTFIYGYFSYLAFWITILAELDARSRFQNYKQIKDQLYKYGYREIILNPVLNSRCQRDAALVAFTELGYKEEVKQFYYKKGYRWYHIIPDFVFSHPQFLFTGAFWKTTFFVPKYIPIREYY